MSQHPPSPAAASRVALAGRHYAVRVPEAPDSSVGDASVRPAAAAEADTRLRLLDAAGAVFADVGFRAATVREICRRADANIAAVSYHFGSKEQLYRQTLLHWVEAAAEKYPIEPPGDAHAEPDARLKWFLRAMLSRLFERGKPAWHGRLMVREMLEPTTYIDEHVERYVLPAMRVLDGILTDWTGNALRDRPELRRRLAHTVLSHLLFYFHAQALLPKVHDGLKLDSAELERVADHVLNVASVVLDRIRGGDWPGAEDKRSV